MKNILVAIKVEKNANALLDKAMKLAKVFNSKIWILHVGIPESEDYLIREAGPQFAREERRETRKKEIAIMKDLQEELIGKNFRAEALLLEGPTRKTIHDKVVELEIDLLIAGHQKRNFFYDLFVGHTGEGLMDELQIPILIVPFK